MRREQRNKIVKIYANQLTPGIQTSFTIGISFVFSSWIINHLPPKSGKNEESRKKNSKFHFVKYWKTNCKKQTCESTAEEVSFEWSHHRISSTDSKVRTALHVSIIDSGSEIVDEF